MRKKTKKAGGHAYEGKILQTKVKRPARAVGYYKFERCFSRNIETLEYEDVTFVSGQAVPTGYSGISSTLHKI